MANLGRSKEALQRSVRFSKRKKITRQELAQHEWHIIYTPQMGQDYFNFYPFHRGLQARKRKFIMDGGMQSMDPGNEIMSLSNWRP
eukprot:UN03262